MKKKYSRRVCKICKEDKLKGRALLENGELDYPYCRLRWRQILGEKLYALIQGFLVYLPGGQPIDTFTSDDNITYEIVSRKAKYYGWSRLIAGSDEQPQYEKEDLMPCSLPLEARHKLAKLVAFKSTLSPLGKTKNLRPQWTANAKKSVANFYTSFRLQHGTVGNIGSAYDDYKQTNKHPSINSLDDFKRCVGACKRGKQPLIGPWNKSPKTKATKK